jgi:hypothetical protein
VAVTSAELIRWTVDGLLHVRQAKVLHVGRIIDIWPP